MRNPTFQHMYFQQILWHVLLDSCKHPTLKVQLAGHLELIGGRSLAAHHSYCSFTESECWHQNERAAIGLNGLSTCKSLFQLYSLPSKYLICTLAKEIQNDDYCTFFKDSQRFRCWNQTVFNHCAYTYFYKNTVCKDIRF